MGNRVLITGGTGNLGGKIRHRLLEVGTQVRIMSRRAPKPGEDDGVEWPIALLASGEGVREAVRGADVIVHTASSPYPAAVEIDGGRHMIEAALDEGVTHFVYISIIGVDKISFSYYENKLRVEKMIAESGLPFSIVRSAQFHKFAAQIIEGLAKLPIVFLPKGWKFQPVSAGDVADVVVRIVKNGPQGRVPDVAGPEVLTLEEMLRAWMEAREMNKPVLHVPVPGGLSKGFRAGHNTAPDNKIEGMTWAEYLTSRFPARSMDEKTKRQSL